MDKNKEKQLKQERRQRRIRAKISGSAERPRLSVSRSNRCMFLQLIDDVAGQTLASAHSREIKAAPKGDKSVKDSSLEFELGKLLASRAAAKKISAVVFDRSGHKFHGRVKAAAEGARAGGLKF